jgi:ATP-dependent Lon protease
MRDFRDAKTMAQTLRDSLTTKAVTISHSESLELVSKMLGVSDWNTLSALLQANRRDAGVSVAERPTGSVSYPAVPIRDFVPIPESTFPLFIGREKTKQALNQAFEGNREVVLAVQREVAVDEPGFDDVYEIGALARLLELEPQLDGSLKVLVQAQRRVVICRFTGEAGAYEAEIADVSAGPIPDARELIQNAVERFKSYAVARDIGTPQTWAYLDQIRDPGRLADIISFYMALPISDKQSLLATLDPVMRLKRVDGLITTVSALSSSPDVEATKRRALDHANQRHHSYATLEHLLLALIDDADACAVMRACNVDLGGLRANLLGYLEKGLKRIEDGGDAKPTLAFHRVGLRAGFSAQELGCPAVTGANTFLSILLETQSPAARFLGEQGVSRGRAAVFVAQGIGKGA